VNTQNFQYEITTRKPSDETLGQYAIILRHRPSSANLNKDDIVQIVAKRETYGSGDFLVKTIKTTYDLYGADSKNSDAMRDSTRDWNWYIQPDDMLIVTKKETEVVTKFEKTRVLKGEKLISGLDSSLVGRRVKVAGKGTFNDLDFAGDETGTIQAVSTTHYPTEGGSFLVKLDSGFQWAEAYISAKYLKLIDSIETAAVKATGPKKRLSKKERELAALPVVPASKDYVRILCAQLGLTIDDIPSEVYLSMVTEADKIKINEIFFAWKSSPKAAKVIPKPKPISNATKSTLTNMATKAQQDYIRKIENNIASHRANAISWGNEIDTALRLMAEEQRKLDLSKGPDANKSNMLTYVEQIIAAGWWTFEEELSKFTTNSDCKLVFSTKDININYTRKDMGVEINLDMGKYYVNYYPYQNNITIDGKEFNTVAGGPYTHPHINNYKNGSICWGNGKQTYLDSMQSGNPVRAFETLQSLIQAYGEAPFININSFVEAQKVLNTIHKDATGSQYKLYNDGRSGYVIHRFLLPRSLKDSPDIVQSKTTVDKYYIRFWQKTDGTGGIFMKRKNDPTELINLQTIYNAGYLTGTVSL
jgi:hypothetical protein